MLAWLGQPPLKHPPIFKAAFKLAARLEEAEVNDQAIADCLERLSRSELTPQDRSINLALLVQLKEVQLNGAQQTKLRERIRRLNSRPDRANPVPRTSGRKGEVTQATFEALVLEAIFADQQLRSKVRRLQCPSITEILSLPPVKAFYMGAQIDGAGLANWDPSWQRSKIGRKRAEQLLKGWGFARGRRGNPNFQVKPLSAIDSPPSK